MSKVLENPNPKIYPKLEEKLGANEKCENVNRNPDEFDARGIFELLRNINDPEHPLTLEQLNVVEQSLIDVDNDNNEINVKFTPTIPHCSMATLIGLSIRTQLMRTIPTRFKVSVKITPGTHVAETAVNKQLADKERVAAALENQFLLTVIDQCLDNTLRSGVEENCCSEENENCCSEEKENRDSGEKESCCSEGKENCCSEEKENRGSGEKENCCSEGKENCCSEEKENRC